jgi:phenylpyruvate tautomerase
MWSFCSCWGAFISLQRQPGLRVSEILCGTGVPARRNVQTPGTGVPAPSSRGRGSPHHIVIPLMPEAGSGFLVLMPYLSIHTNANLAEVRQSELLAAASKIAALHLGKPEEYMMVSVTPVGHLIFGGSETPGAFLELRSIGVPDGKRNLLCAELIDLIASKCGIAKNRVYLVMVDVEAKLWGYDGKTFG